MNKKKTASLVTSIVLVVLGIAFSLTLRLVFHPCAAKEDGSYMNCHWAGEVCFLLAVTASVISLAALLVGNGKLRAGLSLSLLPLMLATALVPNVIIRMCMSTEMRCHAIMRPAVIIFAIVIGLAALVATLLNWKGSEADA